jgi:hypothetical protein
MATLCFTKNLVIIKTLLFFFQVKKSTKKPTVYFIFSPLYSRHLHSFPLSNRIFAVVRCVLSVKQNNEHGQQHFPTITTIIINNRHILQFTPPNNNLQRCEVFMTLNVWITVSWVMT